MVDAPGSLSFLVSCRLLRYVSFTPADGFAHDDFKCVFVGSLLMANVVMVTCAYGVGLWLSMTIGRA